MEMFPLKIKISVKFYDAYETSISFNSILRWIFLSNCERNEMHLPCNHLKLNNQQVEEYLIFMACFIIKSRLYTFASN